MEHAQIMLKPTNVNVFLDLMEPTVKMVRSMVKWIEHMLIMTQQTRYRKIAKYGLRIKYTIVCVFYRC
jgi:hypothetical protein